MARKSNKKHYTFRSWLFGKQEIVEKTAGLVVLIIELVVIIADIFQAPDNARDRASFMSLLTHVLNLFFLVFIYIFLRDSFKQRHSVDADNEKVLKILRLSGEDNENNKLNELVFNANTFVSQLKNFNNFILATAILYVLFLLKIGFLTIGDNDFIMSFIAWLFKIRDETIEGMRVYFKNGFHFLFDLLSYVGAFYMLRCFFVMYLPTIDKNGNDILNKKTNIYIGIGIVLMVLDFFIVTYNAKGLFIAEFICGVVNSVVFILLIARFENKILDIPPFILCILYVYAILQTCLPFVTEDVLGADHMKDFLQSFKSIVLTICLIGKVTLSAVFLYVLNERRIFYYFMTLKKIHEEEEENWKNFAPIINDFSMEPERFSIVFNQNEDASYTANIPNLFDRIIGTGSTCALAKDDLLRQIKNKETGKHK